MANALSISRYTRATYWSQRGGYEGGLWGGQAIGGTKGFGIHWQPTGRGAMSIGPGLPATRFMTTAFELAYGDASATFRAAIEQVAILADDMRRGNRYAATHKAKMAEAESKNWERIGRSYEEFKPSKHYAGAEKIGKFTGVESVESAEIQKKLKLSSADIRKIARMEVHQMKTIGGYKVIREEVLKSGWIDVTFEKGGKKWFWEAGVSDYRSLRPESVSLKKAGGEYGALPGISARVSGGGLIRFYATEHISARLTEAARAAHALFTRGAEQWRAAFYKHVVNTFQTVRSPSPKFKTGSAKTFNPVGDIDARINFPRSPTRSGAGEHKYYEIRIWTMHPVATSHEYGLKGYGEMGKATYPTLTGLGTPNWRFG